MAELDLSKAIEAGARVLTGQILVSDYDELRPQTQYAFKSDTESIITAALPHILDALAEEAEAEYLSSPWHTITKEAFRAGDAARWLRAKAEDVRDA